MEKKTTEARKSTINFIEKLFGELNAHFYAGELIRPEITLQLHTTHKVLGWCSAGKVWKTEGDENYELNVCPEHLTRPFSDIIDTMLHEMAHLYAAQNDIQDCSRSGTYHNKHFADIATTHGLTVDKHAQYGYAITHLGPTSIDWVNKNYPGVEKFDVYRAFSRFGIIDNGNGNNGEDGNTGENGGGKGGTTPPPPKKSQSIKYTCPTCGAIARATKRINITCTDCQVEFVSVEN